MDKEFNYFLKTYFFKWAMRVLIFGLVFLAFVSPDSIAIIFSRIISVLATLTLIKLFGRWITWLKRPKSIVKPEDL
ncbi:hypothetical protein IW492_17465 [Enterococcus sp. BWB1-3]|uniref:hypothetical protein n=1 Tax=Enterococcus sp. BWB1-3 TaxID=2787713 RepID=UPI0019211B44|nr:hypothetical protein [Enterococcus sp. BWB1-3]MBL1231016.1 hypothetical protein [Enterococcus sp. BWB1-3]